MLSYSIAIRTLGTAGEKFRKELESIKKLTAQPDKVIVYIAEGYPRPDFQIGKEEYIWVKKGMVAQRALQYNEISSEHILLLDDDMQLSPDSVAIMLDYMHLQSFDCIGTDVFRTHQLSVLQKLHYMITNLTFPHFSRKWGQKIRWDGSISYKFNPKKRIYLTHRCDGPCMMVRKDSWLKIHVEDEVWMDNFGFSYGEDTVISYKFFKNGFRVGMLYGLDCRHLDGGTASKTYIQSPNRIYIRSKSYFLYWYRSIFQTNIGIKKILSCISFICKTIWLFLIFSLYSVIKINTHFIKQYLKGLKDGWLTTRSKAFRNLNKFKLESN